MISSTVFVAFLFGGSTLWIQGYPGSVTLWGIAAVALVTVVDIIRTYDVGMLNIAHRQRAFAAWNAVDAWARPLMAVLFVILITPDSATVIVAYACATILVYAGFRRFRTGATVNSHSEGVAGEIDTDWTRATRISLARYALPLVPVALFGWLIGVADRFILASLAGIGETGLYIAAYGLASAPLLALARVLVNVFRPRLYDVYARGDTAKEHRVLGSWIALLAGVGGIGVWSYFQFADLIVAVALAPSFRSSSDLLPWLAVAYLIKGLQTVFETRLYAQKRTNRLLGVQAASAFSALVCYFLLIPRYGSMGAAWSTLLSMTVSCAITSWFARPEKVCESPTPT